MFFTKEDERAGIHGSRDPLGVQPIWASFGRKVVANLTTVTSSIRGFTTLLLGRYLGAKAIEEGHATSKDALSIFLRTEQLCAYARFTGPDKVESDIRGIERVKRFTNENNGKVDIGDTPSHMILSDQKTYGLWGLYTVAARSSGFISKDRSVGLSDQASKFVETEYLAKLNNVESELLARVVKNGTVNVNGELVQSLGKLLRERLTDEEVVYYSKNLRDADMAQDPSAARNQSMLSRLMREHLDRETALDRRGVRELLKRAGAVDTMLSDELARIIAVEAVLAPVGMIFDFLQMQHNQTVKDVAQSLAEEWPDGIPDVSLADLSAQLPRITSVSGSKVSELIRSCVEAMAKSDYAQTISMLIKWNETIMEQRGAGPWIVEKNGKLDVRYKGEGRSLVPAKELRDLWRNSYFIDALFAITWQLERTAK